MLTAPMLLAFLIAVVLAILAYLRPVFVTQRRLVLPTSALVSLALFAVVLLFSKQLGLAGLVGGAPLLFGTVQTDNDYIRNLIAWGLLDNVAGFKKPVPVAKTANYTVLAPAGATAGDASGTPFTNRGAVGAVTYTLPAPAQAIRGVFYDFIGVADQTFTVSAGAGLGVAFNNAACASLACSTGGQKIGAKIRATCDGTSWILEGCTVGVTFTVA